MLGTPRHRRLVLNTNYYFAYLNVGALSEKWRKNTCILLSMPRSPSKENFGQEDLNDFIVAGNACVK